MAKLKARTSLPKPTKEQVFREVVAAAIALDLKAGHLKWSMAELARTSGISRPLVYYYFGKSKRAILVEATKLFGGELAGFTDEKTNHWEAGRIDLALMESRRLLGEIHGLTAWYFLQRDRETEVGAAIREIEKRHLAKIRKYLPELDEGSVTAIFALFFGVSFSPLARTDTASLAVKIALRGVR
jgi:AcrR family transcriptional regulator